MFVSVSMCLCVGVCVCVIQELLSQVWPRVTCLLCLLCPRTLESRGLVPPPAKNTPGLHTDQGRIHPMQCFQGCTITNDEKAFYKSDVTVLVPHHSSNQCFRQSSASYNLYQYRFLGGNGPNGITIKATNFGQQL